jgi:Trk-type K+ transport system membrane component
MRKRGLSTSMGIALTLLIAGITVQVTDNLELFGRNSVIPLIIGLIIIFVGVLFFLLLRLVTKKSKEKLP